MLALIQQSGSQASTAVVQQLEVDVLRQMQWNTSDVPEKERINARLNELFEANASLKGQLQATSTRHENHGNACLCRFPGHW